MLFSRDACCILSRWVFSSFVNRLGCVCFYFINTAFGLDTLLDSTENGTGWGCFQIVVFLDCGSRKKFAVEGKGWIDGQEEFTDTRAWDLAPALQKEMEWRWIGGTDGGNMHEIRLVTGERRMDTTPRYLYPWYLHHDAFLMKFQNSADLRSTENEVVDNQLNIGRLSV